MRLADLTESLPAYAGRRRAARVVLLMACIGCPLQATSEPGSAPPAPDEGLYWYDGQVRRPVWVENGLTAEFAEVRDGDSRVANAARDAGLRGSVEWVRIGASGETGAGDPDAGAGDPGRTASPVLRDTRATGGPRRALPGGVIVYLDPSLAEADVATRLTRLLPGRAEPLAIGRHVYFVRTAPGLASLETANRIFESGDVLAASPNWWTERHPR